MSYSIKYFSKYLINQNSLKNPLINFHSLKNDFKLRDILKISFK